MILMNGRKMAVKKILRVSWLTEVGLFSRITLDDNVYNFSIQLYIWVNLSKGRDTKPNGSTAHLRIRRG